MKPVRAITWSDVGGREASLIQRCAARDEDACAELVNEHQRMVYQLSLNLLSDHNEALDLSQEVFLRVFRTHPRVPRAVDAADLDLPHRRQPGAEPSALVAPAPPRAAGVARRAHPRSRRSAGAGRRRSPDRLLGQKQLAERIRVALDRLPFDQKTALVLREIDGLSYEEIGFSLGIAVGTVKSRLARAREGLRAPVEGRMTLLHLRGGAAASCRRSTTRAAGSRSAHRDPGAPARLRRRARASSGRSSDVGDGAAAGGGARRRRTTGPGCGPASSAACAPRRTSRGRRASRAQFDDMHWCGSGSRRRRPRSSAAASCSAMLQFASPERDDSLAGDDRGHGGAVRIRSESRPASTVASRRRACRRTASCMRRSNGPDRRTRDRCCRSRPSITREGRISGSKLLGKDQRPAPGDASRRRVSRGPARAGAATAPIPIAVNLVWLVAHMTVKGKLAAE